VELLQAQFLIFTCISGIGIVSVAVWIWNADKKESDCAWHAESFIVKSFEGWDREINSCQTSDALALWPESTVH
jgi:hypothetical protein